MFIFCVQSHFYENHVVYEMMWENMLEPERLQMITLCTHFVCWITKSTNTHTHTQYAILIAFPQATVVA
jgi:hypothetical protein